MFTNLKKWNDYRQVYLKYTRTADQNKKNCYDMSD